MKKNIEPAHTFSREVIDLGHQYTENRLLIGRIAIYTEPPHDPVPTIPGLSDAESKFLESRTGVDIAGGKA